VNSSLTLRPSARALPPPANRETNSEFHDPEAQFCGFDIEINQHLQLVAAKFPGKKEQGILAAKQGIFSEKDERLSRPNCVSSVESKQSINSPRN
jgi:hypothetical protein